MDEKTQNPNALYVELSGQALLVTKGSILGCCTNTFVKTKERKKERKQNNYELVFCRNLLKHWCFREEHYYRGNTLTSLLYV